VSGVEYADHTNPRHGEWMMVDAERSTPVVVNETEVSNQSVYEALYGAGHREVAEMVRWSITTQGDNGRGRIGGIFQRDRYVTPERLFEQFRVAYDAAESDDVVSGVLDTSEAMAFNRMAFEAEDEDEEDIWNQILFDLDLESRLREMWRELFITSQFYCIAAGQLVWTERGPLPIEKIEEGEFVLGFKDGWNGPQLSYGKVSRAEKTGTKRIFEVKTRNQTLRLTGDHQVCAFRREGNRESRRELQTTWLRADELRPGDVVVVANEVPRMIPDRLNLSGPMPQTARVVGMLVGDGTRNPKYEPESGPTQFKLCVPVGAQRDEWAALIRDEFDCEVDTRADRCCIRFCAPQLRLWAAEVMTLKSPDRFVPSWVWVASTKLQEEFLQGYLDADGCRTAKGWKIAATSERLVREIQVLCQLLGWGVSNVRPAKAGGYGTNPVPVWTFMGYPDTQRQQIPSSYARKGIPLHRSVAGRTVVSVTDTGADEDVYDLEVPSLRSFVVEGVVVHNCVTWWGAKSYRVRGKNAGTGVKRKKTFDNIVVPLALTILDPTKVTPVGNLMFNQDQLAYIADRTEVDMLDAAVLNDPQADPVSRQIIMGKYAPPDYERRNLAREGINPDWLYILNPRNVWRHALTRSQYERFAKVRMKSVFEILDLKQQLRQMDRATLIGGTNFIVLIRKGSDHLPAKPEEVSQLRGQVTSVARVPILVGDHRLSVDIITPKQDYTLNPDKYSTLDARLTTRLYGMFLIHGGMGQPRSDDSMKLGKVIARGMEERRQALRRTLERRVILPTVGANPQLDSVPTLRFHPTRIEFDFDPAKSAFIEDARDRGDLSRDSYLNELDFDQESEARKRVREARDYDHIFTMTNVPFSAPGPGHAVPVGPGGKPNEEPAGTATNAPAVPPHSHAPDGTPVGLPGPAKKAAATKKAAPVTNPGSKLVQRSGGRNGGGNRNGGGAAPGSGQGQAPRTGRPKG
jgi:hypothetical protein